MGRSDSPLLDRMIFVVGARRSGTNWLERILAAHPAVVAIPSETYLFSHGIHFLAERVQHGFVASTATGTTFMERDRFLDASRDFCDAVFTGIADRLGPPGARVVERTPWHALHVELIRDVYPDAYVVHIVRDGRDVARSLVAMDWGPTTVTDAAREWAQCVRAARTAGAGDDRYLEVRYEQLMDDLTGEITRLYASLGLPADEETVAAALPTARASYNVDRTNQRLGAGKWREVWSPQEEAECLRAAGDLLEELGYVSCPLPQRGSAAASPTALARARVSWRCWWRQLRRERAPAVETSAAVREGTQRALDRVSSVLATARDEDADGLFHGDCRIRVHADAEAWESTGAEGVQRLYDLWRREDLVGQHQVLVDNPVVGPSFALVLSHRDREGLVTDRLVTADVPDGRIARLAYYRFPLQSRESPAVPRELSGTDS